MLLINLLRTQAIARKAPIKRKFSLKESIIMKKELVFIAGMITASVFTTASAEVIDGTGLSVNFESANIVGTGRNINMHRVPVINIDTGATTFYDASFKFTFSQSSGFTFEQISSVGISPPLSASNLIPGKYTGDVSDSVIYELSEPSILSDGRLFYTLKNNSGSGDFTAQIVSGDVTNHPDIGSREITASLSSTYTYGIITSQDGRTGGSFLNTTDKWLINQIIGVRQTGSSLSVTLFSQGDSDGQPQDFNTQRDGAVLTRIIE